MKHFFSLQWLRIKETGIVFTDELKRIFRDPGVLVIFIVATLVYPFLYKAIYWNEQIKDIPVAVVDCSQSPESREFLHRWAVLVPRWQRRSNYCVTRKYTV